MRPFSLLLLLISFSISFVLPACAQHTPTKKTTVKKARKKAAATSPASAAGPVLTFERTPCNGTCPAYRMQVYADGRVAYEGRRAVPLMGLHSLKLPAATVAEMLRRAQAAGFDTFAEQYPSEITDLPSTIVAIRQPNGTLKQVTAEGNVPENVKSYFAYLTTQLDQLGQVHGLDK